MLERLSRNWSATHTQIASKELLAVDLQIQIEILFVLTRLLRLRCARWLAVGHGLGQLVKSRRGQLRSSYALPLDNQPVLPPLSSQDAIRHTTFDGDSRALSVTVSFSTLSSQFSPKNKVPTQWLLLSLALPLPLSLLTLLRKGVQWARAQKTMFCERDKWIRWRRDVTSCEERDLFDPQCREARQGKSSQMEPKTESSELNSFRCLLTNSGFRCVQREKER